MRPFALVLALMLSAMMLNAEVKLSDDEKKDVVSGSVAIRELEQPEGLAGKTYEAVSIMNVGKDALAAIIWKFEEYKNFMPNVEDVNIVSRDRSSAVIEYKLKLPLKISKRYRLRFDMAKDGDAIVIKWKLLEWKELKEDETIKDTQGSWRIEDYPGKPGSVIVLYHIYTDPGKIPLGFGWITDMLTKDSLPEVLSKTKERAEKKSQ